MVSRTGSRSRVSGLGSRVDRKTKDRTRDQRPKTSQRPRRTRDHGLRLQNGGARAAGVLAPAAVLLRLRGDRRGRDRHAAIDHPERSRRSHPRGALDDCVRRPGPEQPGLDAGDPRGARRADRARAGSRSAGVDRDGDDGARRRGRGGRADGRAARHRARLSVLRHPRPAGRDAVLPRSGPELRRPGSPGAAHAAERPGRRSHPDWQPSVHDPRRHRAGAGAPRRRVHAGHARPDRSRRSPANRPADVRQPRQLPDPPQGARRRRGGADARRPFRFSRAVRRRALVQVHGGSDRREHGAGRELSQPRRLRDRRPRRNRRVERHAGVRAAENPERGDPEVYRRLDRAGAGDLRAPGGAARPVRKPDRRRARGGGDPVDPGVADGHVRRACRTV